MLNKVLPLLSLFSHSGLGFGGYSSEVEKCVVRPQAVEEGMDMQSTGPGVWLKPSL